MSLNPQQSAVVFHGFDETLVDPYTCRECGADGDANQYMGLQARLAREQLCFICSFWTEKWTWAQAGDVVTIIGGTVPVVRVGGEHYTFAPDAEPGEFQGHGGREMTAIMNDGRILTSRNVWHQGTIPERWRERLPDNAVWKPYEPAANPLHAAMEEIRQGRKAAPPVAGS